MKSLLLPAFAAQGAIALHSSRDTLPTASIDSATVTGTIQGNLTKFLGIPFGQAPVGDLRFRAPQAIASYNGTLNGSSYGAVCPQQTVSLPLNLTEIFGNVTIPAAVQGVIGGLINSSSSNPPESEDCLSINIIKPSNVPTDAKLPVLVWIFGGGFERGGASGFDDLGVRIVNRSMELGQPVIYAAMNYRVSAWGFIASQEVQQSGEGNMGLQDQRLALQWIQKYISQFGGDPSKVTIWGQSAGAISASLQMLAYGGNSTNLFRGAFMQSGAPIPVGNMSGGQKYYDSLVNQTSCGGSNDTLSCLRKVPLGALKAAVDNTPNYFSYDALALAWSPRADGRFLQDNPQKLVEQDKVMNISIVTGNADDEGTLFSLSSLNITSDEDFKNYISTVWVPKANESTLEPLHSLYPPSPSDGSPFDTDDFNAITPQFKRIAAFQGDVVFQAPRRFFLQNLSGKQKLWSYLSRRLKFTPVLGSFHASDLKLGTLDDYLIRFTYNLDPNNGTGEAWPEYTSDVPSLYMFPEDGDVPEVVYDTYRDDQMRYLFNLSLDYPL